jgi:hypothetical protein
MDAVVIACGMLAVPEPNLLRECILSDCACVESVSV